VVPDNLIKSEILPLNLLIDYFRTQFMHQYLNKFLPVTFIGECGLPMPREESILEALFFAMY
jgi:hypothetical protein